MRRPPRRVIKAPAGIPADAKSTTGELLRDDLADLADHINDEVVTIGALLPDSEAPTPMDGAALGEHFAEVVAWAVGALAEIGRHHPRGYLALAELRARIDQAEREVDGAKKAWS